MDYQGCKHPLPILYTLRSLKSIRCYFSYDIACTVDVGIDLSPVRCSVQSTRDALAAKRVLLIAILPYWQRVQIKQAGFTGVGLFCDLDANPYQFRFVGEHRNETSMRDLHKVLIGALAHVRLLLPGIILADAQHAYPFF